MPVKHGGYIIINSNFPYLKSFTTAYCLLCQVSDEYMPKGLSEMSRFSKVSSIFGRDAFATMRYVTLLNVSEIRDISNDERKVPFKNDDYLASGTLSFRRACKSIIRDNKI